MNSLLSFQRINDERTYLIYENEKLVAPMTTQPETIKECGCCGIIVKKLLAQKKGINMNEYV